MPTIDEVVGKYIELRDRKTALAKKHSEEMSPLNQAMEAIESWLLAKMNEEGVDSYKTGNGTPYKSVTTSVKMEDPEAFKRFIFSGPLSKLAQRIENSEHKYNILQVIDVFLAEMPWDMVDFRAGKKGILNHLEAWKSLPPGVTTDSFTTVNVRRS